MKTIELDPLSSLDHNNFGSETFWKDGNLSGSVSFCIDETGDESRNAMLKAYPWLADFRSQCISSMKSINIKTLLDLAEFYIINIKKAVKGSYKKPIRAAKLKIEISNALKFFHYNFEEVKSHIEHFSYLEKMSDLMAMYMDMEIMASSSAIESIRKIASKITSSLKIYFGYSPEYILDSILKTKIISKRHWDLCDLIFGWALRDFPETVDIISYLRYILVFKLWKEIMQGSYEKQKQIIKLACLKLPTPYKFKEKLKSIRPLKQLFPYKLPDSDITSFLMKAKFAVRDKVKKFYEILAKLSTSISHDNDEGTSIFKQVSNQVDGLLDDILPTMSYKKEIVNPYKPLILIKDIIHKLTIEEIGSDIESEETAVSSDSNIKPEDTVVIIDSDIKPEETIVKMDSDMEPEETIVKIGSDIEPEETLVKRGSDSETEIIAKKKNPTVGGSVKLEEMDEGLDFSHLCQYDRSSIEDLSYSVDEGKIGDCSKTILKIKDEKVNTEPAKICIDTHYSMNEDKTDPLGSSSCLKGDLEDDINSSGDYGYSNITGYDSMEVIGEAEKGEDGEHSSNLPLKKRKGISFNKYIFDENPESSEARNGPNAIYPPNLPSSAASSYCDICNAVHLSDRECLSECMNCDDFNSSPPYNSIVCPSELEERRIVFKTPAQLKAFNESPGLINLALASNSDCFGKTGGTYSVYTEADTSSVSSPPVTKPRRGRKRRRGRAPQRGKASSKKKSIIAEDSNSLLDSLTTTAGFFK